MDNKPFLTQANSLHKTIMVVEDSVTIQWILRRLLASYGTVLCAGSVEEAVKMSKEAQVDLIICDYMLPYANGLTFVKYVRQQYNSQQVPIIMISAAMDDCLKQDSLSAGANICMSKPLNGQLIKITVQQLLKAPYVENPNTQKFYYTVINWSQDGKPYFFCPEFQITVQAERDQALAQIQARILERLNNRECLAPVTEPGVNRYMINTGSVAQMQAAA